MSKYLNDCDYAAKNLVALVADVTYEYEDLREMHRLASIEEAQFRNIFYQRQWHPSANYFHGLVSEASGKSKELESLLKELKETISTKFDAVNMLCGALLQIAKQGLSKAFKNPSSCPSGRKIGEIDLKWAVWSGRNQSIHYEEPKKIDQQVAKDFKGLTQAFRENINPKDGINHAYDIVIALDWLDYDQFKKDVKSITK